MCMFQAAAGGLDDRAGFVYERKQNERGYKYPEVATAVAFAP